MTLWQKIRFDPRVRFAALTVPGALFVILFLLAPLFSIIVFSFWRTESYELIADWNLDNYRTVLGDWIYLKFIFRSLAMAGAVSFVCLLYAWPCAYLIAKHGGRYRLVLVLLTAAPFLTGILLRVTAMQQILGPIGLINMGLTTFGLAPIEAIMYTNLASAIGLIYLWIPFMLLAVYLSLLNFNFVLLEVAKVCGAKPWRHRHHSRLHPHLRRQRDAALPRRTQRGPVRQPAGAPVRRHRHLGPGIGHGGDHVRRLPAAHRCDLVDDKPAPRRLYRIGEVRWRR
jgi:ABC-type spermidine/putrescine transport system permease subunit II